MNVVKADVMDLARALRIDVDGTEPVRLVFARCIERARELAVPVELYGAARKPAAVREWARLALADVDAYVQGIPDDEPPGPRAYGYLRGLCMIAAEHPQRPSATPERPSQQRAEEWAATQGRRRERSA